MVNTGKVSFAISVIKNNKITLRISANASPMLQLARIADRKISEATLRSFLGSFGFSGERMDTPCESFSGGERARLALALIVWQRPNVLILDEPTNHLDLDAILWLEDWLIRYQGTLILISHDRDFLDSVVNNILHIEQQRLTLYRGGYSDFERQRAEKLADKLGITLTALLNLSLSQLVESSQLIVDLQPNLNSKTTELLLKLKKEAETGKNLSQTFTDPRKALKWLHS